MKYVDPSGNEFRYSLLTSSQFTKPNYAFSYGTRIKTNLFNIEKKGFNSEVNLDFIASGKQIFERLTHPIYSSFSLDLSKDTFIGKFAFEHTSAHSLSLGVYPDSQLKDFPSIIERRWRTGRFEQTGGNDLFPPEFKEEIGRDEVLPAYFDQTNSLLLTLSDSSTEFSGGVSGVEAYSTLNSVLGLKGPPVLAGEESSGLFARVVHDTGLGKISAAGIFGQNNPFYAAGFKSKEFSVDDKTKLSVSALYGPRYFGGCVTLLCK